MKTYSAESVHGQKLVLSHMWGVGPFKTFKIVLTNTIPPTLMVGPYRWYRVPLKIGETVSIQYLNKKTLRRLR